MDISVSGQLYQAVSALIIGAVFGFFYDMLRAVRRRIRLAAIAAVSDTIFWLVVAVAVFIMGMVIGGGEVRIFMVAFTVLGAVLYFVGISKFTLNICNVILDAIIFTLRLIARPFVSVAGATKKNLKKFKKHFKKFTKCGTMVKRGAKKSELLRRI